MANFIRWNPTTHIYELSTNDGTSFVPLPLNASIVNEGTIDVARIPNLDAGKITTGIFAKARLPASIAYEDEANTFAALTTHSGQSIFNSKLSISFTQPQFDITDTSAAVDARVFNLWSSGGVLYFRTLNDALSVWQTTPLYLHRAGYIAVGTDLYVGNSIYEKGRTTPQGHWIAVPFAAGNFTGAAPMTWTVAAGNIAANRYTLVGKTLTWNLQIFNTTLSGTASNNVGIAIPGGFVAAANGGANAKFNTGGAWIHGDVQWSAGTPSVQLVKSDFSNFTLGTFYAYVGTFSIEVQ